MPMDFLKHAIFTAEVNGETLETNVLVAPIAIILTKILATRRGVPEGVGGMRGCSSPQAERRPGQHG